MLLECYTQCLVMPNILDLQSESRRQIKKPALMCLGSSIKLRKIASSGVGRCQVEPQDGVA